MKQKFQYGNSLIDYDLSFQERKTLGIRVYPDKTVKVLAPLETPQEKVDEKIKLKAAWILKQQDFFCAFHPFTPERKYVSGETHLYLGKQYRLKLFASEKESVKLKGKYFEVGTKDKTNKDAIEKQMKAWYKQKANIRFNQLFEELKPLAKKFYEDTPALKYRWMSKRWGSCDKDGTIHLNLELIKAPKKCIEYVIIHELCHLKYLNHSTKFFQLLEKELPNWRETKDQLEKFLV